MFCLLNEYVNWRSLLVSLGILGDIRSLPAAVTCTFCGQEAAMVLTPDSYGGLWYYCQKCGSSGDMIKLSAAQWKLEIEETIKLLIAKGFITYRSNYTPDIDR